MTVIRRVDRVHVHTFGDGLMMRSDERAPYRTSTVDVREAAIRKANGEPPFPVGTVLVHPVFNEFPSGTILECDDCHDTFVLHEPLYMGLRTRQWEREGRIARWWRTRKTT